MSTLLRIGIASALVALSVGGPCMLQHQAQLELRAKRDAFEQQARGLAHLVEENGQLSHLVAQPTAPALTAEQLRELLRLRNERRSLAEQTNLLARLATGAAAQDQLSLAKIQTALAAELTEAMKRILPALQPALQAYALAHSNEPPSELFELQDYFPLVAGRKMAGLQIIEFVRGEGPKPGDALLLRGNVGRQAGYSNVVRVYGFSDGRVVQVSSEDGHFDDWETQHLISPLTGTEEKVLLEAEGTARERARITEFGASLGISAEDTIRFFDRVKQEQQVLGQKIEEMQKELAGSPQEKQLQMRAAIEAELNKLAIETLGNKGPALVQKMMQPK